MTTYEEWRVTGSDTCGRSVDAIWRPDEDGNDCEGQARGYVAWASTQEWTDGPHLHKRTVTVTDWEQA